MSAVKRSRSMTAYSTTSSAHCAPASTSASTDMQPLPRFNNFRPARYQTKEEIDRFFGTTSVQKREQRLRVRESDGHVYFDWIEKDEWQHLLATGALTSPNSSAEGRRRSSTATYLTLNSPLCPASPARSASLTRPGSAGLLVERFGEIRIAGRDSMAADKGKDERRGRKRNNSALAGRNARVDDQIPLGVGVEKSWIDAPGYQRRQSDIFEFTPRHTFSDDVEKQEGEEGATHSDTARIHIFRIPLSHRKLDQETLDQTFGLNNPLLDLTSSATLLNPASRTQKPAMLHIPFSSQRSSAIEIENETSPTCSSPPRSPITVVDDNTFDSACGTRRGTFGSLLPLHCPSVQVLPMASRRIRHQSDTAVSPPSSAAMEFLHSPVPSTPSFSQPCQTLRHAVSFDNPRQASSHNGTAPPEPLPLTAWAQRQRWHSAGVESNTTPSSSVIRHRTVSSVASLRETAGERTLRDTQSPLQAAAAKMERSRKISGSSEGSCASEGCFTPLAPRTGAKKFDRTRTQHLDSLQSPSPASIVSQLPCFENASPMRDPVPCAEPQPSAQLKAESMNPSDTKPNMGMSGLRTGPQVYDGLEIPCASIHLYSDPEDNVEPALAFTLSASKLKKLKKKNNSSAIASAADGEGADHSRRFSATSTTATGVDAGQHAKGSSRWWNHILHN